MEALRFTLLSLCNLIYGIIGLILGFRIVLKLIASNASIPIVGMAYNITDALVYPFRGILQNITMGGRMEFDFEALLALLGYSIIFYLLAAVINNVTHVGNAQVDERIVQKPI